MTISHELFSTYAFTSITGQMNVKSGDTNGLALACIQASFTPQLGAQLSDTLTYVPLAVLTVVALATAAAAIYSPWGSTDVFRFTSNYGRDDDLLRLVTPGFGDCLQYLQFIVLAGSLSLNYPGFYQPVVSQISWSALMFNQSFVSQGKGYQSITDGIYTTNGSYGLERMGQLVGMSKNDDVWAGMIVWLLVIIGAVVLLIQLGFGTRWAYHFLTNTQQQDLRQKNFPFCIGNAIRIVFNYFLLPIVALSTFQLVIAGHSPAYVVALAVLLIVFLVLFAGFLLWLIATTRPRSYLFDDLPTVLLYGPLYNTYSDNAATFALVPVVTTFLKGITIGAVQPSGIAQIVLLAICEVIYILTLNAFRPFHSPTSMNLFHTLFAVVRLITILLSIAFLPSLGVDEAPRGWIGYIILLLHAVVLVFGFFLNSVQTLIEVGARMAGAGVDEGGNTRGGLVKVRCNVDFRNLHDVHTNSSCAQVFGMRQLSRRHNRRQGRTLQRVGSDAAMLAQDNDQKSLQYTGNRSRSVSGSSAILLNRPGHPDNRKSIGLDSSGSAGLVDTPTSGGASAFSYLPGSSQIAGQGGRASGGIVNLRAAEKADPYYRPPRPRKSNVERLSPRARARSSLSSTDWANRRRRRQCPEFDAERSPNEELTASRRGTPVPAHLGGTRERSDSDVEEGRTSKTDYATREVDFYYGVRGPALSNQPTRRLKTGPADPTGPVSSASGWLKSLFGGKTKEKGKGFEVVRSSRMPPLNGLRTQSGTMLPEEGPPYSDDPLATQQPERNRNLALSDEGDAIGAGTRRIPDEEGPSPVDTDDDDASDNGTVSDDEEWSGKRESQISHFPPSLPTIETTGGIELPSRMGSKASSRPTRDNTQKSERAPALPRRSSRRDSSTDVQKSGNRLSTVTQSPATSPRHSEHLQSFEQHSSRLPFETHKKSLSRSTLSSAGGTPVNPTNILPATPDSYGLDQSGHSSSVLGGFDRPSSLGYVQQHRTSDNIHTANLAGRSLISSSAEVVENSDRRSPSPDIGQAL